MLKDLFVNAAIIVSFISVGNHFLKDLGIDNPSKLSIKALIGISNGFLGILLIIFSVHIENNIIVDFRNLAIIISALYGGIIPALLTSVIIALFRVLHFGITVSSITAAIVLAVILIFCILLQSAKTSKRRKMFFMVSFSIVVSSIAFSILIKDIITLVKVLVFYSIGIAIISFFSYYYIEYLATSAKIIRRLKLEATVDFLTGLNNVRQFDKLFNKATSNALSRNERLSVLFIDIDHFKNINDTYGHLEGDEVLKQIGELLIYICRPFDIVSRIGGEEFSILLLDCPSFQAAEIGERIRSTIQSHQFELTDKKKIKVTISIGVATYPDTVADINKLKEKADEALYKAKRSGRNKVVSAE